ncbi:MAG TPA: hypothetical protein VGV90_09900 [Solirubrobacteraceae bacterium]|jgi:hypothetical protein|nr:hypothetical protein [Solirubrobacteraceae bacterium]
MQSPTQIGTAGLQGWRVKAADAVAEPLARRTPLETDQVRAAMGALFFVLAVSYVVKTLLAVTHELRGS